MLTVGIIGTRGVPNRYGGFERFVELLVEDAIWSVHKVRFIVYGEGVDTLHGPSTRLRSLGLLKSKRPLAYYVRSAMLATQECDVILCCGVGLSYFALWPMIRGKVLVVNPDGCEWRRTKWSWFGRLLIRVMYWPALAAARHIDIDAEALRKDFGAALGVKARYMAYQAPEPHSVALRESTRERWGLSRPFINGHPIITTTHRGDTSDPERNRPFSEQVAQSRNKTALQREDTLKR